MEGRRLVEMARKWLGALSKGMICHEVEAIAMEGLQVVQARKGFILCHFLVPSRLSDRDGNWHVGAMATLIDNVGAAAIWSSVGNVKSTVNLNISYYSTAKIQVLLSSTVSFFLYVFCFYDLICFRSRTRVDFLLYKKTFCIVATVHTTYTGFSFFFFNKTCVLIQLSRSGHHHRYASRTALTSSPFPLSLSLSPLSRNLSCSFGPLSLRVSCSCLYLLGLVKKARKLESQHSKLTLCSVISVWCSVSHLGPSGVVDSR